MDIESIIPGKFIKVGRFVIKPHRGEDEMVIILDRRSGESITTEIEFLSQYLEEQIEQYFDSQT